MNMCPGRQQLRRGSWKNVDPRLLVVMVAVPAVPLLKNSTIPSELVMVATPAVLILSNRVSPPALVTTALPAVLVFKKLVVPLLVVVIIAVAAQQFLGKRDGRAA